jgi:DNA-binding CsgD family transcriptional regulator
MMASQGRDAAMPSKNNIFARLCAQEGSMPRFNSYLRTPTPEDGEGPRVAFFDLDDAEFAVLTMPLCDRTATAVLTLAEREIAILAAAGLNNKSIAHRRVTKERTVANQMATILRKLRVGARYMLASRLALGPLQEHGTVGG